MDDDNIIKFGAIEGGKPKGTEESIPVNPYVIWDIDNNQIFAEGFLVFTPNHVAVMRDLGDGAVPVLVVPLHRVKSAEIYDPTEDDD